MSQVVDNSVQSAAQAILGTLTRENLLLIRDASQIVPAIDTKILKSEIDHLALAVSRYYVIV